MTHTYNCFNLEQPKRVLFRDPEPIKTSVFESNSTKTQYIDVIDITISIRFKCERESGEDE